MWTAPGSRALPAGAASVSCVAGKQALEVVTGTRSACAGHPERGGNMARHVVAVVLLAVLGAAAASRPVGQTGKALLVRHSGLSAYWHICFGHTPARLT